MMLMAKGLWLMAKGLWLMAYGLKQYRDAAAVEKCVSTAAD